MSFSQLLDRSIDSLRGLALRELQLPATFARIERAEKTGRLVLENRFFALADRGELRTVRIYSPKIQIVTQFLFPRPELQLPVYAMEFVVLGPRPIVGVIDAVCLQPGTDCAAQVNGLLRQAHARFPQLAQADDMPQWYQECRSGADFFVRPRDEADIEQLGEAHLEVLQGIASLYGKPAVCTESDAALQRQNIADYKDHHRINSPGLKLMQRSFGDAWTEDYMSKCIFR